MLPALLVLLCVVMRIVPHPWNFSPMGGASVLAGRTMPRWAAIATVVGAMVMGDLMLAQLHGYPVFSVQTPFVYAGFLLQMALGRRLRAVRGGAFGAAGVGALVFFAVSNLGVWLGGFYGWTAAGLVTCYVAALPFLAGTVIGDIVWTGVLTSAYEPMSALALRWGGRFWVPRPGAQPLRS